MPNKGGIPKRVVIALLCATGVMELYISRINLSIAIVAMVQIVSSNSTILEPFCFRDNLNNLTTEAESKNATFFGENFYLNFTESNSQENERETPKITMTALERGNILSAFFYAYGLSGIFGGRLAEIYGTKKVFGIAVVVDALGNFLIPVAAKMSYGLFFFIRFTMGIFQGACYPSLHALVSRWIPPHEQPTFVAFVYPASSFGTIFTLTVYGLIISKWGWEATFYISGSISLLWLALWLFLAYDNPAQHPRISEEEKLYIQSSKSKTSSVKPKKAPILKILTSLPLWAINIAHAGNVLGSSFLLTQLPIYMSSIIGVNIRNSGLLSSLPFLARYFSSNIFGLTAKRLLQKDILKKKMLKRIVTFIGFGGPGLSLLLVGYTGCNITAATTLFVLGMFLNGANFPGYNCNHLDLTSNFSGTAFGLSSTVGFLYAMIGPVLVGALTPEETLQEWRIVYWLIFGNYIITGAFYCIFISVETQPWDSEEKLEEQLEELNANKATNLKRIPLVEIKT